MGAVRLCCSGMILTVLVPPAFERHLKARPCACDSSSFHLALSSCSFRSLTHGGIILESLLGKGFWL